MVIQVYLSPVCNQLRIKNEPDATFTFRLVHFRSGEDETFHRVVLGGIYTGVWNARLSGETERVSVFHMLDTALYVQFLEFMTCDVLIIWF